MSTSKRKIQRARAKPGTRTSVPSIPAGGMPPAPAAGSAAAWFANSRTTLIEFNRWLLMLALSLANIVFWVGCLVTLAVAIYQKGWPSWSSVYDFALQNKEMVGILTTVVVIGRIAVRYAHARASVANRSMSDGK